MKQPVKDAITILVILAVFGVCLAAWGYILSWAGALVHWLGVW